MKYSPKSGLIDLIKLPFLALGSRKFYMHALFKMGGVGLRYLVIMCLVLALPTTYKVLGIVEIIKSYELTRLMAQIPPSYIDANGILSAKNGEGLTLIKNSGSELIIVYNPQDEPLPADAQVADAPIIMTSHALIIRGRGSTNTIGWDTIFERGANFEPLQTAKTFEDACNAPVYAFYFGSFLYLFGMVIVNTLICAAIGRIIILIFNRIRISFGACLRVASFANTVVMVLLTLQFFISLPLTMTVMVILPLLYMIMLGRMMRVKVDEEGFDAFKKSVLNDGAGPNLSQDESKDEKPQPSNVSKTSDGRGVFKP